MTSENWQIVMIAVFPPNSCLSFSYDDTAIPSYCWPDYNYKYMYIIFILNQNAWVDDTDNRRAENQSGLTHKSSLESA